MRLDGDVLVKRWWLVAATCALIAAPLAHARDWRSGFGPQLQLQAQPAKKAPGQHPRGERGKHGGPDKAERGRLTQEERRELNRDLDRANREIYRP